eukprot:151311_1
MSEEKLKWIDLERDLPPCTVPISINDRQYFVATVEKGIYKFDTVDEKWSQWIEYPDTMENMNDLSTGYDANNQIIYAYEPELGMLIKINHETKEINITRNLMITGCGECAIFINNKFHVIGGVQSAKHLIYNEKKKQFDEVYDFQYDQVFGGSALINLRKTKQLLLIGGYGGNKALDTVYSYKYCEINPKWNKWDIHTAHRTCFFGCAITTNEDFVILLGGSKDADMETDNISVINLKTNAILISDIVCPNTNNYHAIIMADELNEELVVFGFIRQCWQNELFSSILFPHDSILKLIRSWYSVDYLYLQECNDTSTHHWKISVDDIINSCWTFDTKTFP